MLLSRNNQVSFFRAFASTDGGPETTRHAGPEVSFFPGDIMTEWLRLPSTSWSALP